MKYDVYKVRSNYGDVLARRREALGLTQKQLAERAGITRNPIATAEAGLTMMDTDSLLRVCNALEIGADELFKEAQR